MCKHVIPLLKRTLQYEFLPPQLFNHDQEAGKEPGKVLQHSMFCHVVLTVILHYTLGIMVKHTLTSTCACVF